MYGIISEDDLRRAIDDIFSSRSNGESPRDYVSYCKTRGVISFSLSEFVSCKDVDCELCSSFRDATSKVYLDPVEEKIKTEMEKGFKKNRELYLKHKSRYHK